MKSIFKSAAILLAALLLTCNVFAGTLDNAPFTLTLPDSDWHLNDARATDMGKEVFLLAIATNQKMQLRTAIIRTDLEKVSSSNLEEMCAGIRDSFKDKRVKKISDTETTFLGYKGRAFAYEMTQNGQTTYNETILFIVGKTGWTIAASGLSDRKDAVKKILGFYKKK